VQREIKRHPETEAAKTRRKITLPNEGDRGERGVSERKSEE
jgi:hypothetical protein